MAKKRIDKDKIVNAFLYCAAEKSAGAVSLQDIASVLSVNKASLYNHFASRDEIFEEAILFSSNYILQTSFTKEEELSAFKQNKNQQGKAQFLEELEKIIVQYFSAYQMDPLFQMYPFIESCKFFSDIALDTSKKEIEKIATQTQTLAEFFTLNISSADLKHRSIFFANTLSSYIGSHLATLKGIYRNSPSFFGSLFSPPEEKTKEEIALLTKKLLTLWE